MSNYNTQLQSNNIDLQMVLQTLQTKAAGGEQATPVISVNSANGLITATAGTKSATHQLTFQPAKTITPTTADQIAVSGGYYTGGNITVKGDSNLVAENIAEGVSIFGVTGTHSSSEGSGGGSVETCTVTFVFNNGWGGTTATAVTYEDNRFFLDTHPIPGEIQNVCQNSNINVDGGSFSYSVDSEDGTSSFSSLGIFIGTSNTTVTMTYNQGGNPFA